MTQPHEVKLSSPRSESQALVTSRNIPRETNRDQIPKPIRTTPDAPAHPKPRLANQVRQHLRALHDGIRNEGAHGNRIKRSIPFHTKRRPTEITRPVAPQTIRRSLSFTSRPIRTTHISVSPPLPKKGDRPQPTETMIPKTGRRPPACPRVHQAPATRARDLSTNPKREGIASRASHQPIPRVSVRCRR
jgi:hypothetical protein